MLSLSMEVCTKNNKSKISWMNQLPLKLAHRTTERNMALMSENGGNWRLYRSKTYSLVTLIFLCYDAAIELQFLQNLHDIYRKQTYIDAKYTENYLRDLKISKYMKRNRRSILFYQFMLFLKNREIGYSSFRSLAISLTVTL